MDNQLAFCTRFEATLVRVVEFNQDDSLYHVQVVGSSFNYWCQAKHLTPAALAHLHRFTDGNSVEFLPDSRVLVNDRDTGDRLSEWEKPQNRQAALFFYRKHVLAETYAQLDRRCAVALPDSTLIRRYRLGADTLDFIPVARMPGFVARILLSGRATGLWLPRRQRLTPAVVVDYYRQAKK